VSDALDTFIDDVKDKLVRAKVQFTESRSKDLQKTSDSRTDLHKTHNKSVVRMLNNKVREPRQLLFYPGALFSATVNTNQYSQSQTLIMIDVPSLEDVENRAPLTLYAQPSEDSTLDHTLNFLNPPTMEDLLARNSKEVKVNFCPERLVTRDHISACRMQYALTHVGASTVRMLHLELFL